jgi:hypothetical protein
MFFSSPLSRVEDLFDVLQCFGRRLDGNGLHSVFEFVEVHAEFAAGDPAQKDFVFPLLFKGKLKQRDPVRRRKA